MKKMVLLLLLCILTCLKAADDEQPIFTFVVYGDNRSSHENHTAIIKQIALLNPNLVINTGDMVTVGLLSRSWTTFLKELVPLSKTPFYPVLGNHDVIGISGEKVFKKHFPDIYKLSSGKTYYSFTYPDTNPEILFIILDSHKSLKPDSPQGKFLSSEMQKSNPKLKMLAFHHPPYSPGAHGDTEATKKAVSPYMNNTGLRVVFNGHDHLYARQRVGNVWFVVAGGGGAPLTELRGNYSKGKDFFAALKHSFSQIKVYKDSLRVITYDKSGKVIDDFGVTR